MTQSSDLKGITLSTVAAGLVGGTTSTYTTTAATAGCINGKFVTALAAQTNTATPTAQGDGSAFDVLAAGKASIFVFTTNAAGALAVFQGTVVTLDESDGFVNDVPQFPAFDEDLYMPFGYAVIINGAAGSNWTFGASNWTATGITDTFTDCAQLPHRPVTA